MEVRGGRTFWKQGLGWGKLGQPALGKGRETLTFGEFGVLDLHFQLGEENVLCGVLTQVPEYLEGMGGAGRRLQEASSAKAARPPAPEPERVDS